MLQIIHKPFDSYSDLRESFLWHSHFSIDEGHILVRRLFYGFRWNRINFTILRPPGK